MDTLNYTELQFYKKNAAYIEERLARITVLFNKEPKTEKEYREALLCQREIKYKLDDILASVDNDPATVAKTAALQRRCNKLFATMLD